MNMPPGHELLVMPRNADEIEAAKARSRRRLTRTAAVASAASIIPLPGIDIAVDAAALIRLIPEINREFGLTPEQIEQLSPNKQLVIYKAIVAVGGAMIGKLITREIVIEALKAVGVRLTVKRPRSTCRWPARRCLWRSGLRRCSMWAGSTFANARGWLNWCAKRAKL